MAKPASSRPSDDTERTAVFPRLADEHRLDAYKLANTIMGNPAEAQDAVHDAFVRAWDKWSTLRDPERFEPWSKRIVVNTCRNRLKRRSRQATASLESHLVLASTDDVSLR